MDAEQKIFCVVSHTHWDREWYAPLENFRHRLVDLIDRLLVILERSPAYVFHLDAQTVVLEDYLAVRPEKKELLRQCIQSRRILVGPWYLQNDFYLTSGEATIRNLLEGARLCADFGGSGQTGYAPDQFGNISQLPQILKNFGIDTFVFGRGFSEYERDSAGKMIRKPSPTEFIWEGADGTQVLAVHMRHWYNNAQRFPGDLQKSFQYLRSIEAAFDNEWTLTPYLLLMNGVDHLEAQPDLLEILEGLQARLPEGQYILQYNLDDYMRDVKAYLADHPEKPLHVHRGELRSGQDQEILHGTLSSRHYLKVANVEAQSLLENRLEPLYAMLERAGMQGVTSKDHFRYLWKNLLRNHPHDSICGCSRDEVHAHMENRYAEFAEFGEELLRRGMRLAADHTALCCTADPDDYLLTVANTLAQPMSGIIQVSMPFLLADGFDNFEVVSDTGEAAELFVTSAQEELYDVFSPVNLPGSQAVQRYEAYVDVGIVAPYALKTFRIRRLPGQMQIQPKVQGDGLNLTNGFFTVAVDPEGSVTLTAGDRTMRDCLYLEDRADIGDAYTFARGSNLPLSSAGHVKKVEVVERNPFVQALSITYALPLPESYDFAAGRRSAQTALTTVVLTLTLKKGQPFIGLAYTVENRSRWHRLRIVLDTGIVSAVSTADIPFDVVTHGEEAHYVETQARCLPNTSFASIGENGRGVAVLTKGAHEYEHLEGSKLAFTVVRATGRITDSTSSQWQVPGNQCLRTLSGSMAIVPFTGDVFTADVPNLALQFRAPLCAVVTSCDTRKFTGGRPYVQDTELNELFYLPDAYPAAAIPSNRSAVSVTGPGVTVSAFKQAEDGSGQILRLVNLMERPTRAKVCASGQIFRCNMAETELHFCGRDRVEFAVDPKEIVTLLLR